VTYIEMRTFLCCGCATGLSASKRWEEKCYGRQWCSVCQNERPASLYGVRLDAVLLEAASCPTLSKNVQRRAGRELLSLLARWRAEAIKLDSFAQGQMRRRERADARNVEVERKASTIATDAINWCLMPSGLVLPRR